MSRSTSRKHESYVKRTRWRNEARGTPVIGVGGITTADEGDSIIRSGKVKLVAVGRAILEDPKWASKVVKSLNNR